MGDVKKDSGSERLTRVLAIISIAIALAAAAFSGMTLYQSHLKPFAIDVKVLPSVGIQHKGNLGIYLSLDCVNNSPSSGYLSDMCLVIWHKAATQDRYCLVFNSFRVLSEDKVSYALSEETLPIYFEHKQRHNRIVNFIFDTDPEFPVMDGVYQCELYVWKDWEKKSAYCVPFEFALSSDLIDTYKSYREKASTYLSSVHLVGFIPLEARKLTTDEYEAIR